MRARRAARAPATSASASRSSGVGRGGVTGSLPSASTRWRATITRGIERPPPTTSGAGASPAATSASSTSAGEIRPRSIARRSDAASGPVAEPQAPAATCRASSKERDSRPASGLLATKASSGHTGATRSQATRTCTRARSTSALDVSGTAATAACGAPADQLRGRGRRQRGARHEGDEPRSTTGTHRARRPARRPPRSPPARPRPRAPRGHRARPSAVWRGAAVASTAAVSRRRPSRYAATAPSTSTAAYPRTRPPWRCSRTARTATLAASAATAQGTSEAGPSSSDGPHGPGTTASSVTAATPTAASPTSGSSRRREPGAAVGTLARSRDTVPPAPRKSEAFHSPWPTRWASTAAGEPESDLHAEVSHLRRGRRGEAALHVRAGAQLRGGQQDARDGEHQQQAAGHGGRRDQRPEKQGEHADAVDETGVQQRADRRGRRGGLGQPAVRGHESAARRAGEEHEHRRREHPAGRGRLHGSTEAGHLPCPSPSPTTRTPAHSRASPASSRARTTAAARCASGVPAWATNPAIARPPTVQPSASSGSVGLSTAPASPATATSSRRANRARRCWPARLRTAYAATRAPMPVISTSRSGGHERRGRDGRVAARRETDREQATGRQCGEHEQDADAAQERHGKENTRKLFRV